MKSMYLARCLCQDGYIFGEELVSLRLASIAGYIYIFGDGCSGCSGLPNRLLYPRREATISRYT